MGTLEEILDQLVKCIVAEVSPRRVVLFGSATDGVLRPGGDIDLLIVMPDGAHRRQTAQHLYGRLGGDRPPVDLVVATESDILAHGDAPGYVYRAALRDGREMYAA